MKSFLYNVVQDLIDTAYNPATCTYVVPSRRVRLFLNNTILASIDKPVFAPTIFSIEEFAAHTAGIMITADLEILPLFYKAYCSVETKNPDSYDEFLSWAITILADFNEVDRHLVVPTDFFSYLGDVKELDTNHWSLTDNPTQMVSKYLRFWKKLHLYYDALTTLCMEAGIGYQGLVYRAAFAKAESSKAQYTASNPIVFLGLNATTKSESEIIQSYLNAGIAKIYWDTESHFLEHKYHEAGAFIRNYFNDWNYYKSNKPFFIANNYLEPKKITICGAIGNLGMTQVLINKLNEIPQDELSDTAVVLADETLLIPVLQSIPENVMHINVTMGISIDKTPLAAFVNDLFKLHLEKNSNGFYFKNVLAILESPFTQVIFENSQVAIDSILSKNLVYITSGKELEIKDHLLNKIIDITSQAQSFIETVVKLLDTLRNYYIKTKARLELEQLLGLTQVLLELKNTIDIQDITLFKTAHFLYRQLIPLKKLDLIGEPVAGLQIMGLLETRALDFKNIILLSVNEGTLPAGKSTNSYIPYDMKIRYQLPTYTDKDSVYAYHFYRLLHRCENATLIYNSQQDTLGGGERSRFISQILADDLSNHNITSTQYAYKTSKTKNELLTIRKSMAYRERLDAINLKGFSPSALTSYIRNPLQFFENKILRIKDLEEVEENIALNTMGTIIHETLDNAYKPFCGSVLTTDILKIIKSSIPNLLATAYKNVYASNTAPTGKNKIIHEVATHYVHKMVQADLDTVVQGHELIILETEKTLTGTVQIPHLGTINLLGNVDRIDLLNGVVRIIDYKTGSTAQADLKVEPDEFHLLKEDYKKSKAFQVLMYTYMLAQHKDFKGATAGIISFKNFNNGYIAFKNNSNRNEKEPTFITNDILLLFEEQLIALLEEIYNPAIDLIEKEV